MIKKEVQNYPVSDGNSEESYKEEMSDVLPYDGILDAHPVHKNSYVPMS